MSIPQLPNDYVLVHVAKALTSDRRVGELGLVVTVEHDAIVISGSVSTESRREAVTAVTREALDALGDDRAVRNETHLAVIA